MEERDVEWQYEK